MRAGLRFRRPWGIGEGAILDLDLELGLSVLLYLEIRYVYLSLVSVNKIENIEES